jgi:tetratricopeptide (TPR) repeat protein
MSCDKIHARVVIKQANEAYQKEDYATALKRYEQARSIDSSFPDLTRLIGYSYIGLFKPEDKSPQNIQYADKAINELQAYLKVRPNDTAARETLINLLLNAERTDQAIQFFVDYLAAHPADLDAVRSIATLFAKKGDFQQALNWYEKITLLDSRNPEAFYTFGVVCYENVAKNNQMPITDKPAVVERGKAALAKAIAMKPDYFEANVYMNLLFREQAKLEVDPLKQQALYQEADKYRNAAIAITKSRKAAEKKTT